MTIETFFEKFELFADAPNAVAKIRELILRLAFTGKLSGKDYDENSCNFAKGWESRTISSIASSITSGFACSKNHQVKDGYVHLRTHNISTSGSLNFDLLVRIDPKMVPPRKASIRRGDILFNNTNSQELVGKTCFVDRDFDFGFSNHITKIRLNPEADPAFVVLYLTSLRNSGHFAKLCTRWINQAAINVNTLEKQIIPLPSLGEQKRIVAKVDELMALCDRLEEQQQERKRQHAMLTRASWLRFAEDPPPSNLNLLFHKSYIVSPAELRKAILTLAIQGKLVPQDPTDEPAENLLISIAKNLGITVLKQKAFPGSKALKPFDLPKGWAWSRFPDLGQFGRGKSKHRPRNDPSLFVGGVYPLVQTGDVARASGTIQTYTSQYNGIGLAQSKIWPAGTMCITIAANIADSGILGFDACFPDSIVGFIPASQIPSVRYFEYFMRTAKEHLEQFAPSTAQKNINLGILEQVLIPIPPAAEQRRIVAKVDELLALVDQLEAQINESRIVSAKLLDALVAELNAAPLNSLPARPIFDTTEYFVQLIAALLRALQRPLPFHQLNATVALLFLPDQLVPLLEATGGTKACFHFAAFSQPNQPGAVDAAIQLLAQTRTIRHVENSDGVVLHLNPKKIPPIDPVIAADASYLAAIIDLAPAAEIEEQPHKSPPIRKRKVVVNS